MLCMYNLLKSDFYKLVSSKISYILLIIPVCQGIIISYFRPHADGSSIMADNIAGQEFMVLFILMGIAAAIMVANDFAVGGIRSAISYGHNRMKIVLSKAIIYFVYITVMSLAFPITSAIINTSFNGFGSYLNSSDGISIGLKLILLILIYIAESCLFFAIAFISRNNSVTIATAGIITVTNIMFYLYSGNSSAISTMIYTYTPYYQTMGLLQEINIGDIIHMVGVCVFTILTSFVVIGFVFNRVDVN